MRSKIRGTFAIIGAFALSFSNQVQADVADAKIHGFFCHLNDWM